jgi:16S rRNA (adenine(1408)-N(1))-methyltransferase
MESIQGKHALFITAAELYARLTGYQQVLIDLGTGDGRFVEHVARTRPDCFAIGLDACRENLREASRRALRNTLYGIANVLALPEELRELATEVTINFPWGSLLEGLLTGEAALLDGLAELARPGAHLTVRLNGGALAEAGWSLYDGAVQIQRRLNATGFTLDKPVELDAGALRQLPTTWAKRLAFGRDPRALTLSGKRWGAANQPLPYIDSQGVDQRRACSETKQLGHEVRCRGHPHQNHSDEAQHLGHRARALQHRVGGISRSVVCH